MGTQPHPGGGSPHCHPGLKSHTSSLWFKSTLLLFLRLLLSTKKKKRDGLPNLFFLLLLPRKTGHREWYITDLQTWREGAEHTADSTALGRMPRSPFSGRVLGKRSVFRCPKPSPGNCLSQIGQRTGDPATGAAVPSKVTTLCTDRSI